MEEIWKDIPFFEGYYQASNCGRIRSIDRCIMRNNGYPLNLKGHILPQYKKKNGRMYVNLSKNGVQYSKTVHRLVLSAFVENVNDYNHINHKDENPENNYLSNLEWCTEKYNHNYGSRNSRHAASLQKKINMFTNDGVFIRQYNSIKEASINLQIDASKISKICKHKWKYKTEYIFEYA